MPWWECAKNNPQLGLPNTYSYWNVHFNEAKHPLASMKWQQILEGISCGYDEIICMTEILFSPPLCFLLLTDELERVPFLRALLKCIMHNNVKIDTTYPQDGFNAAKKFVLEDRKSISAHEKKWYDILTVDIDVVTHFYHQLGLST